MKNPTNATNLGGKTIGVSIPTPTVNQDEGKALIVNSSGTGLTFGEAGRVDDVVNSAGQSVVTNKIAHLPNGTVQLLNQSATFVANTDSSTNTEFPYRASVTLSGVTSSTYAEVVYSNDQATSLNYAPYVDTTTDTIYIYSRTDVGTVTIPTISIGMDYSDITIDSTPTSGSGNAVSSGGVYTALSGKADDNAVVKLTGNQTIAGIKTHTNMTKFNDIALDNDAKTYLYCYSDGSGVRSCNRADNTTSDRRALLEILSNNDGSVQLRLQKRTVANDTYLSGDFVSRMEVVDLTNSSASIQKTGIGTKLTNCKYCILDWHDIRQPLYHISTVLTGQSGGYSAGTSLAPQESVNDGPVYFIWITAQNTSVNQIDLYAKSVNLSSSWGNYITYFMVLEKITFIYA